MRGIVDYFLDKKGVKIGDYVEVFLIDGVHYRGIVMPKHEYSMPEILVLKLDNGYNIGLDINKVLDIKLSQPPKISLGIKVPKEEVERRSLPKVLIIGIGGTILSKVDYTTGAVKSAVSTEELLSILPEVNYIAEVETKIIMNKYSEHLKPEDWSKISREIYSDIVEGDYDGIVVLHGTDTLGYTAAALSFSIQHLPIPVVLVGSQRSSDRPSSDAAVNLISAIRVAAYSDIAEVVVVMHNDTSDDYVAVHQGVRVRKNHTSRRDAFQSIDISPYMLVDLEGNIKLLRSDYHKRDKDRSPTLYPRFSEDVSLIKFYPGFNKNILLSLLQDGVKAVVIEGTGLGHVGESLYEVLSYLTQNGVHVYMTSQCIWGRVNMNVYDTGRFLRKIGVIPLENIISETAYVKASWCLGNFDERELDSLMTSNVVGEASPRSPVLDMRRGL
jgi:glutamyl-tRNA(Gln) amidotransferase subunit D